MSKLSLKIIVIFLLMSPFNIQAGWCMDEEAKECIASAARKATRIIENTNRHKFEQDRLELTQTTKDKRGSAKWICKNCKQSEANCYGFGGGKFQAIKTRAKELQSLLENMESQN